MTDKSRERRRRSDRKKLERPDVDPLTVGWMLTFVSAVACQAAALAVRWFVRMGDPTTRQAQFVYGYLLLVSALVGLVLLVLTPIVVRRRRSNPPLGIVIAAYVIGALPWFAIALESRE